MRLGAELSRRVVRVGGECVECGLSRLGWVDVEHASSAGPPACDSSDDLLITRPLDCRSANLTYPLSMARLSFLLENAASSSLVIFAGPLRAARTPAPRVEPPIHAWHTGTRQVTCRLPGRLAAHVRSTFPTSPHFPIPTLRTLGTRWCRFPPELQLPARNRMPDAVPSIAARCKSRARGPRLCVSLCRRSPQPPVLIRYLTPWITDALREA